MLDTTSLSFLFEVGSWAKRELNESWKLRTKKVELAEEQYLSAIKSGQTDEFSQIRRKFINESKELYADIIIKFPPSDLLINSVEIIYDSLLTTYLAQDNSDFDSVEFRLKLIRANIDKYKNFLRRQQRAKQNAIIVSMIAIILIVILVSTVGEDFDSAQNIPILSIPWSVMVWSFIGSITAILYRFNFHNVELQDPFRWLYTRPITGVVMGILLYLAVKVGLIAVNGGGEQDLGSTELIWIVAFIGGFSDQLSDSVLKLLVGRFGGDETNSPLNQVSMSETFEGVEVGNLFRRLSTRGKQTESNTSEEEAIVQEEISQQEIKIEAETNGRDQSIDTSGNNEKKNESNA